MQIRQEAEARLWTKLFGMTKDGTNQEVYRKTYVKASLEAKASGKNKSSLFEEEAKCVVEMLCTVDVFTIAGPATLFILAMILHLKGKPRSARTAMRLLMTR